MDSGAVTLLLGNVKEHILRIFQCLIQGELMIADGHTKRQGRLRCKCAEMFRKYLITILYEMEVE